MAIESHQKLNTFQRVRGLNKQASIVFCNILATRMYINYRLFSELNGFGDCELAENIINLVWEYIHDSRLRLNLESQLKKVESITPDTKDFDNFGVYPALEFCMALTSILELVCDEDDKSAVTVSKLSQGGTEAYITEIEGAALTGKALNTHYMMEYEIGVQNYLLDLCEAPSINFEEIKAFLSDDLTSNIGLSK